MGRSNWEIEKLVQGGAAGPSEFDLFTTEGSQFNERDGSRSLTIRCEPGSTMETGHFGILYMGRSGEPAELGVASIRGSFWVRLDSGKFFPYESPSEGEKEGGDLIVFNILSFGGAASSAAELDSWFDSVAPELTDIFPIFGPYIVFEKFGNEIGLSNPVSGEIFPLLESEGEAVVKCEFYICERTDGTYGYGYRVSQLESGVLNVVGEFDLKVNFDNVVTGIPEYGSFTPLDPNRPFAMLVVQMADTEGLSPGSYECEIQIDDLIISEGVTDDLYGTDQPVDIVEAILD